MSAAPPPPVSLREASRFWAKLGWINFGGPAGQIALMHEELVVRRRWIGEERFLHALNYCMLLPGPEATQLATYVGWLLHRAPGGLIAGALLSWARALGEFGATLMFAGNLEGRTQTLPLAIYTALEADLRAAQALSIVLVLVALGLLLGMRALLRSFERGSDPR